jgi:hypothetical protein
MICPNCDGEGIRHNCCDDMCRGGNDPGECISGGSTCHACGGHGSVGESDDDDYGPELGGDA